MIPDFFHPWYPWFSVVKVTTDYTDGTDGFETNRITQSIHAEAFCAKNLFRKQAFAKLLCRSAKTTEKATTALTENELSKVVIGAAIEVHKELGGPGLLEDIYEEALCYELSLRSITVQRQVGLPVIYKGRELRKRLVLVGAGVIVEVKAVEQYNTIIEA